MRQPIKMSVYSPLSVVEAMRNGIVDNYWNKTEPTRPSRSTFDVTSTG